MSASAGPSGRWHIAQLEAALPVYAHRGQRFRHRARGSGGNVGCFINAVEKTPRIPGAELWCDNAIVIMRPFKLTDIEPQRIAHSFDMALITFRTRRNLPLDLFTVDIHIEYAACGS